MSKYQINENPGDTPTVLMVGTFSMDDLATILDEMQAMYYDDTDTLEELQDISA